MAQRREIKSERIARLAYEHSQAAAQAAHYKRVQDDLAGELIGLVDPGQSIQGLTYEGHDIQVTSVDKMSTTLDERGLRKAVPNHVWNAISERRLSQERLNLAIKDEKIDAEVVAAHTEQTPQKRYPRVTVTKREVPSA